MLLAPRGVFGFGPISSKAPFGRANFIGRGDRLARRGTCAFDAVLVGEISVGLIFI